MTDIFLSTNIEAQNYVFNEFSELTDMQHNKGVTWPGLCHSDNLCTPTFRDVHVSSIKSMEYCNLVVRRMLTLERLTYTFSMFYLMPSKPINSTLIGNALTMSILKRHMIMTLWESARSIIIYKSKKKIK